LTQDFYSPYYRLHKEEYKIKDLAKTILQLGKGVGMPMLMHAATLAFFESARNVGYGEQS